MLSRDQINAYLAVIIETVSDMGDRGCPSGHLYAAMMGHVTIDEYQGLMTVAKTVGLVTESSHVLRITDKGRSVLARMIIAKAGQKAATS